MKNKILLLFLFSTIVIKAQYMEAEIIFNDNVSIEGFGYITLDNEIVFTIDQNEEPDIWTNLMAKGITFYGFEMTAYFEYIQLSKDKKPELLEVVTKGEVTLYAKITSNKYYSNNMNRNNYSVAEILFWSKYNTNKYANANESITTKIYIKKDSEDYPTSLNRKFNNTINSYFSDCTIIGEKLKNREFNRSKIKEIVEYYNYYCEY